MASITLTEVPIELYAHLESAAAANYRSVEQEVMRRLERTFQIDAALTAKRSKQWTSEPAATDPVAPLEKKKMDAIRDKILKGRE